MNSDIKLNRFLFNITVPGPVLLILSVFRKDRKTTILAVRYLLIVPAFILLEACRTPQIAVTTVVPRVDSSLAVIRFQQKKEYSFNNGTVHFSNRFASARLNNMSSANDSSFILNIEPENTPVNPSPWYAFKVWGATNQNIKITLKYARSRHRYDPKLSTDGVVWQNLPAISLNRDSSEASFSLQVSPDTLTVAAQEIISSASAYKWINSLSQLSFIRKREIGYSILGKPISALNTTGSNGRKIVLVLSRQHPPEVTGFMAMQEFVQTVTSSTPLARQFRKKFELIVIPMINPDGVDEGTWRHSAAGVDLNRDWIGFLQPETRAIRNFILNRVKTQKAKVYFGIDFHSTWYDVFYTNSDTLTNTPGLTRHWLAAFQQAIPGFKANVRPSGNEGNVSKSWMMRALGADALTYEVGDDTPRDLLKEKGRIAAEKLMELLLASE